MIDTAASDLIVEGFMMKEIKVDSSGLLEHAFKCVETVCRSISL